MLANHKKYLNVFPDNVAIIGGGRWARVFIEVLCGLVPSSVRLSVHSPHNAKGMVAWVADQHLEKRIRVFASLPNFSSETSNAVIVVNAARDHEKTVEWVLEQGYPVLVEKPLCLNFVAAQRLVNLALTQKIYLATAHVFLFASYVEAFSKLVSNQNSIISIRVLWKDPQYESRYGEVKSYDPGLPVYADWLPHILSILGVFLTGSVQLRENLVFLRGGAHLNIHLDYGQTPCVIELERNGNSRQRIVEVTTLQETFTLDFGNEPGTIYTGSTVLCSNSDWHDKPRPVAKMLATFLKDVAGGVRDTRLDISIGLSACKIIDHIASFYHSAIFAWLNNEFAKDQGSISCDLRYALTEILQMKNSNSAIPIEQRIDYIYRHLKEHITTPNCGAKHCSIKVIELIIKQGKKSSYL